MTGSLDGKVAVVTGGGLGIGRAIAKRFGREGARVVIGTRGATDGQSAVAEIRAAGGEAKLVVCDLGIKADAVGLIKKTLDLYGRLDIIVHNAAVFPFRSFEDLTDQDLDDTFNVNLKACFWLVQAGLPALRAAQGGGRVLITSSVSGNHANAPGLTHYSASKAGVTGFVRNLALDLAGDGITVNAVEPGFILTERNAAPERETMVRGVATQIPMRRCGTPDEVANVMRFLASSEAAYVTGQSIVVDGGLTLGTASSIKDPS